jgi:SAM-dependent methyltransferase
MYVPDPVAALAEMRRAVQAGGRLVATVWGERRHCGWADIFPIVDARVSSEVCPLFFGLGAPGALLRAFADAGLPGGEERRESPVLHFVDAEALLTAVLLGGPVAMAVKRFTPDEMDAVRAEFLASVAAYRQQDGSYAVPGEFVMVAAQA